MAFNESNVVVTLNKDPSSVVTDHFCAHYSVGSRELLAINIDASLSQG